MPWLHRLLHLQSPPAVPINNTNALYPTFTVEMGKRHESFNQLKEFARDKHFAGTMGVMVHLAVKIYPTQRMKVVLLERDAAQGYGYIDPHSLKRDSSALPLSDNSTSRSLGD
jgi:hypothetical protein